MTNIHLRVAISAGLVLAMATTARADFLVSLDTSPLSGTHTLAFGLNNSNIASNTIALTDFSFGGGTAVSGTEDCTFSNGVGCSGELNSQVTLEDLDFQIFFTQQFNAGSMLSFVLSATNNFASGTPDQFAMYLCDSSLGACYSDDLATGAMLLLDLTGGSLSPASFILNSAGDQGLSAPVVSAVPEPGTLILLSGGLAALVARRIRTKHVSA
jgi:hypothetical protein